MPTERLTVRRVETLQSMPGKRFELFDATLPGFGVRVSDTGVKSWIVYYRQGGVKRRLTIGRFPALSLADAREQARTALREVDKGRDPSAEKVLRRRGDGSFLKDAVDLFLDRHASKNRTAAETRRIFENCVLPKWKHRRTADITRRDVISLIDEVADRTPIRANRVFAHVRKFFNWALSRDLVEHSPTAGLKPPTKERSRDRVLSDAEIAAFWSACAAAGYSFTNAFRLLLLTGQRRSEVIGMRWSELDLEEGVWTIPAARTKNGKAHIVPLGNMARDILRNIERIDQVDLVFPAKGSSSNPISGVSKAKGRVDEAMLRALRREDKDAVLSAWRLHDLRRTFASGCRRAGVLLDVVEKLLNHSSGSFAGIVGVYQLHDYSDEKHRAVLAWERMLRAVLGLTAEERGAA